MIDKLLCPFCQHELEEETFANGRVFVSCNNPNCIISDWGGCSKQIIMELINERQHATDCQDLFIAAMAQKIDVETELETTRKALDVAADALKWIDETYELGMGYEAAIREKCQFTLEQINNLPS